MSFSIDEFNSSLNRSGGVAQKSQSLCVIVAPQAVETRDLGISHHHLPLRIESFTYPSRSIVPIEYKDYGPVRTIGGQANFTEVTATIILSADMREREYFMRWQDLIVGHHRNVDNPGNPTTKFDVGYFDDYKANTIEIRQYNQISTSTEHYLYNVMLVEAVPTIISETTTDWAAGNEIQKMNVTFAYRFFYERYNPQTLLDTLGRRFFNKFFNTGLDFNNIILENLPEKQRRDFVGALGGTTTLSFFEGITQDTVIR